jgi:hypothetical protein
MTSWLGEDILDRVDDLINEDIFSKRGQLH